jgi:iron complex outermembrane receptor protein
MNAADSVIVKGSISDESGMFTFENIKPGKYLLKISYIGYIDTLVTIGSVDSSAQLKLEPIILKSSEVNLNEVSVTAMKKPMEFKNGNVIVTIDGSPMAIGNSVYDLLMRLPGVVVNDGVISIQGKAGVRVLIDDRIQPLSGDQLIGMLKSMSATMIGKIEILKNPPVKYDASGNAGMINIVTKKVKITGFSGSVNFSNQQGFYDTKIGGFSLNYKGKKLTFYSGGSLNEEFQNNVNHQQRAVTFNGVTTSLDQHSREKEGGVVANVFAGLDWFANDKNTFGIRVEDMPGSTSKVRIGANNISDNSLGYSQLDFKADVPNTWNVIYTNANAEHLFDTLGTKLKFNADYYGPYIDVYPGTYQNNFYNSNGSIAMPPSDFNNTNTIKFSTLMTRLDFEKKISKTFSLEAGAKGSFQDMQSSYLLQNLNNTTGTYVTDTNFTNKFTYKEQILAGYVNLQKQLKKFALQGGLRAENTDIHTLSITNGIAYTRQYFNVFPTASIGYNKKDKHNFQVSFNRRIDRPDYDNFNPYRQFFGSILATGQGNPFLYPAYTNNYEVSHNYKGIVGSSFSYSRTENYIFGYPVQNDSTKQTVSKLANLKTAQTYAFSVFLQKDLTKWWTLSLNATGYYFSFNGTVNGANYSNSAPAAYAYASNMINLPKNFKIEVSGLYLSPMLNGVNKNNTRWAMNFAIKKSFLDGRLNFSVGVNDLFFTLGVTNNVYVPNQFYRVNVTFDTRRLVTGLTWNFGKVKVQAREVKGDDADKKRLGR